MMESKYHSERGQLCDSFKDVTAWLTILTDKKEPCVEATEKVAKTAKYILKSIHYLDAMHGEAMPYHHETWGDADPKARELFEALETHYMGFWKSVAEYKAHPSEELKHKMLHHFKEQLNAHDALAMFVKGNCPALCPEIGAILTEWKNKKMSATQHA